MLGTRWSAAGPGDVGMLSFRGDTPAASDGNLLSGTVPPPG